MSLSMAPSATSAKPVPFPLTIFTSATAKPELWNAFVVLPSVAACVSGTTANARCLETANARSVKASPNSTTLSWRAYTATTAPRNKSEVAMPGTAVFLRNARRFFRSNISTSRVEGQYRNWYRRVNPLCGSSHSTMNANFSVGSACVVRARETRVRRGRNRSADGGKRKSLSRGATRRSRAFGCDANSVSKPPRSGTQRSPREIAVRGGRARLFERRREGRFREDAHR